MTHYRAPPLDTSSLVFRRQDLILPYQLSFYFKLIMEKKYIIGDNITVHGGCEIRSRDILEKPDHAIYVLVLC